MIIVNIKAMEEMFVNRLVLDGDFKKCRKILEEFSLKLEPKIEKIYLTLALTIIFGMDKKLCELAGELKQKEEMVNPEKLFDIIKAKLSIKCVSRILKVEGQTGELIKAARGNDIEGFVMKFPESERVLSARLNYGGLNCKIKEEVK